MYVLRHDRERVKREFALFAIAAERFKEVCSVLLFLKMLMLEKCCEGECVVLLCWSGIFEESIPQG